MTKWSPALSFLYKFISFLTHLRRKTHNNLTLPHARILSFLQKMYVSTITLNTNPIFRYREIINQVFPEYPQHPPSPFFSTYDFHSFVSQTIHKCRSKCHAKHQLELHQQIKQHTARNELLRREGRLKKVIQWVLEKHPSPRFSTVVTTANSIKAIPKAAHKATLQHFTNHFSSHPWIHSSHINSPSAQGDSLRQHLLNGTWRSSYPTLTHTLPLRHQPYAATYFDNFKYKATTAQQQALQYITSKPITFDTFHHAILHRPGMKSPGPSGLTLSVLQATPIPILESIHSSLNTMWLSRHIPVSWKTRELALLP